MPKSDTSSRRTAHSAAPSSRRRSLLVGVAAVLLLCMLLLHLRRVSALWNAKAAVGQLHPRADSNGQQERRDAVALPPGDGAHNTELPAEKNSNQDVVAPVIVRSQGASQVGTGSPNFLTAEFPESQLLLGGNRSDTDRIHALLRRRAAPSATYDKDAGATDDARLSLLLIPVNDGYLEFGLNLMCSLLNVSTQAAEASLDHDQHQYHHHSPKAVPPVVIDASLKREGFVFVAMDAAVHEKLSRLRLPVFRDPDIPFVTEKSAAWGDPKFHSLVCTKLVPVLRVLRLGLRVILTDADMVFLRNPTPFYRRDVSVLFSIGSCHKDLPDNFHFLPEGIEKLNTGFYVADPTPTVIDLFARALSICRSASLTGDQPAINQVIQSDWSSGRLQFGSDGAQAKEPTYRYGFFDGCLFANGCVFFKHLCANTTTYPAHIRRRYETQGATHLLAVARNQPVLVHANFLVGKKDKAKHLRKYGLWNEACIASWLSRGGLSSRL